MPPVLDSIILQFSKNPHESQLSTVYMTTHTLARDLRKDTVVSGVEVTSFFWNDTRMALKLVFADTDVPDLRCEPIAALRERSVRINLQNTIDQLIFRPIKNEFKKLEAATFQEGQVMHTTTVDSIGSFYIVRDSNQNG